MRLMGSPPIQQLIYFPGLTGAENAESNMDVNADCSLYTLDEAIKVKLLYRKEDAGRINKFLFFSRSSTYLV